MEQILPLWLYLDIEEEEKKKRKERKKKKKRLERIIEYEYKHILLEVFTCPR